MNNKKRNINLLEEKYDKSWSQDSIRFINTPSPTAKNTFFYVQEAGFFKTSAPYFTERKNLNSFLIIATVAGCGELQYNGQSFLCSPNSVMFIHCEDAHRYSCCADTNWDFYWVHFNGPTAFGFYNEYARILPPVFTPEEFESISDTMKSILESVEAHSVNSELITSGLITTLLTNILMTAAHTESKTRQTPEFISPIVSYIEGHFAEEISLDDLSHRFGISKYYLSRKFKEAMGTSVHEYLTMTRINHAKELLTYSNLTIEEISHICGYNYASHFIDMFAERENISPLQYRKKWSSK